MIENFKGKTAVLTGAGSGFGLECARIGAQLGMNLVLVDVQQDALDKAEQEMTAQGVQVLARKVDVSNAAEMHALAEQQALEELQALKELQAPQGVQAPAYMTLMDFHRLP